MFLCHQCGRELTRDQAQTCIRCLHHFHEEAGWRKLAGRGFVCGTCLQELLEIGRAYTHEFKRGG